MADCLGPLGNAKLRLPLMPRQQRGEPMPWKHRWHQWLTRHWDEEEWNGWEATALRIVYLTVCMLGTLLAAPLILSEFLHSFVSGLVVATLIFAVYSWVIVGHYPEQPPAGA